MAITATAHDLITLALKMSGVLAEGQTAQAEQINDSFNLLNSMIASFAQSRWLIWHLTDASCVSTGAQTYSVGPGGDINVVRPDRLNAAYGRLLQQSNTPMGSGPVDFPLVIMESYEEYASLRIKQLHSFPSTCFYDATMPFGTLYVWPIPNANFEIHIVVKDTLDTFPNLYSPFMFPPEYYEAMLYSLSGRISLLYQLPMNPGVIALAKAALNTIQVANHRVPDLGMPSGLMRHGGWAAHGVGGVVEGTFTLDEDVLGPA